MEMKSQLLGYKRRAEILQLILRDRRNRENELQRIRRRKQAKRLKTQKENEKS